MKRAWRKTKIKIELLSLLLALSLSSLQENSKKTALFSLNRLKPTVLHSWFRAKTALKSLSQSGEHRNTGAEANAKTQLSFRATSSGCCCCCGRHNRACACANFKKLQISFQRRSGAFEGGGEIKRWRSNNDINHHGGHNSSSRAIGVRPHVRAHAYAQRSLLCVRVCQRIRFF